MKRALIIFCLVLLQLGIILFLGILIKKKLSPRISFNPLKKDSVLSTKTENLDYFYEPVPNSTDSGNPWVPYNVSYNINSDALNEERDYKIKKDPGVFRIITLGDSWTFGLYVKTPDNWSKKLEGMLNTQKTCASTKKYEVINLGVQGYDLQYSIERFKERGEKYNPDLVIWLIKNDDYLQINELVSPLVEKIDAEIKANGEWEKDIKKGENYPSWNRALEEYQKKYSEDDIYKKQKDILASFDKSYNNPLLIVTFPPIPDKGAELINSFVASRPKTYFFQKLTDVTDIKGAYFEGDWHPNQKGHLIIARDFFNYLNNEGFLPCR